MPISDSIRRLSSGQRCASGRFLPDSRVWVHAGGISFRFFGSRRVFDRALSRVPAVRCARHCPGLGLDRPLPKAALDTFDYPVLDAAVFHAQPTSFAQMGPPLLAAFLWTFDKFE
jgi:hypothetical protein